MKTTKKAFSLFLCLVLCLGMAPVSARGAADPELVIDLEGPDAEPILLSGEDLPETEGQRRVQVPL